MNGRIPTWWPQALLAILLVVGGYAMNSIREDNLRQDQEINTIRATQQARGERISSLEAQLPNILRELDSLRREVKESREQLSQQLTDLYNFLVAIDGGVPR